METGSPAFPPNVRVGQLTRGLSALPLARALALLRAVPLDLAVMAGLLVLAAVPRLVILTDVPPGLHGDEAWTGLDARRVVNEGWIGPYVGSALGQPAGPLYFAAPVVAVLGDSIFSIRLSMALLAIVTVPVAYLTFTVMFNRTTGVFAALLLAFGLWHLHFSRIAFMVISWPLMELLTLLFLFYGVRTGRWWSYALAGLALGAGVYTYNAYPVFALPLALLLLYLGWHERAQWRRFAAHAALFIGCALFAALPMIQYASNSDNGYLQHHRGVSLLETEDWKSRDFWGKAKLLRERTGAFFISTYWDGEPDGADGSGDRAMVDRLSVMLATAGAALLVWRWRRPESVAVLLMVLLLPAASIISIDAMFRRSVGVTPFIAALAAVPLAFVWDRARSLSLPVRAGAYLGVGIVVAAVAYLNLNAYFGQFRGSEIARSTFVYELTEAVEYVDALPGEPYVYLFSARWGINYETRLYLAPDMQGEDRSVEFRPEGYSLNLDRSGDVVYVFLDAYLDRVTEVERLYPGGEAHTAADERDALIFSTYLLRDADAGPPPEQPGAPDTTPTVTPTTGPAPGGAERDAQRQRDLGAIAAALEQYRQANGHYPDNEGGIQSLCVYPNDVGCELREFLDPIPLDPLGGDPAENGYWYISTGDAYTVYAQREADAAPVCTDHPDHLGRLRSVMCVTGP